MAKAKSKAATRSKSKGGPKAKPIECHALKIEMSVEVAAPPRAVWDALVRRTATWWPADFYSSEHDARMTIEPRAGGRLFEDRGRGAGAMWGLITEFHPNSVLAITGHTASKWGGPNLWVLRIEFEEVGKGTRLSMVNDVVGRVDAGRGRDLENGWMFLFGEALKGFVERKSR